MVDLSLQHITAHLADETEYHIAYWEARSGKAGPRVLVTAAMHGNELQGAEMLRRFVESSVPSLLRGSCALVPLANPVAIQRHTPHIDFELGRYYGRDTRNNLNCAWPGDPKGSSAQRLAHALMQSLIPEATHLIDLHCWGAAATTALARGGHAGSMALARASAVRFIRASPPPPEPRTRPVPPCTLSDWFLDSGRPAIAVEFDGQYCIKEGEVRRGLRALNNGFRELGMLPGAMEGRDERQLCFGEATETKVPSPCAGLFVQAPGLATSEFIARGQSLGHLLREDDLATVEVRAPVEGYLYSLGRREDQRRGDEFEMRYYHPHVAAGTALATLVS